MSVWSTKLYSFRKICTFIKDDKYFSYDKSINLKPSRWRLREVICRFVELYQNNLNNFYDFLLFSDIMCVMSILYTTRFYRQHKELSKWCLTCICLGILLCGWQFFRLKKGFRWHFSLSYLQIEKAGWNRRAAVLFSRMKIKFIVSTFF